MPLQLPHRRLLQSRPNGVNYDTSQDIIRLKYKIMQPVVVTKTRPQNNKSRITQEKRDLIGAWVAQGVRGE